MKKSVCQTNSDAFVVRKVLHIIDVLEKVVFGEAGYFCVRFFSRKPMLSIRILFQMSRTVNDRWIILVDAGLTHGREVMLQFNALAFLPSLTKVLTFYSHVSKCFYNQSGPRSTRLY